MKKTLLILVFLFICLTAAGCGPALVVDSAGDEPDANPNDGVCKTVNNDCTLRAAIMEANDSDDISKITFASNLTISPTKNLPSLISNNTQIKGEGKTIILDGAQNTDNPKVGIQILDSQNNIIQGLKIRHFLYGIHILSDPGEASNNTIGMSSSSTNGSDEHNVLVYNFIGMLIEGQHAHDNVVSGNYIGVDSDGVTAQTNDYDGLQIREGAHHNLIGSLTGNTVSEGGNLVSGNDGVAIKIDNSSPHNHISGNYIGTQESGDIALGNGAGIKIQRGSNNNTIGIALSGDGQPNLISGNSSDGLIIDGSVSTIISGNLIGVNSTGDSAIPNRFGIYFHHSSQNIIGTDGNGVNDANEGNLISGNIRSGIQITHINSIYNVIAGNKIGTNYDGTQALGNGKAGISSAGNNTIIGTNGDGISDDLEGNLISGNNQALVIAGLSSRISGNIIGLDITGTIDITQLGSGIAISSADNLVGTDGDGQSDELERNIISGLGGYSSNTPGITIYDSGNVIAGNYIGTDITGTIALSSDQDGIRLRSTAANNLIGTDGDGSADLAEGNLISGNGRFGIDIRGGSSNTISGNLIGTDFTGTTALPNGYANTEWYYGAVQIGSGSSANVIGTNGDGSNDLVEGNVISGNAIKGVVVSGSNAINNVIAGNKIGTDISGGSSLGNTAGIEVMQGAEYTVIGTNGDGLSDPAEANIISGNGDFGIRIDSPANYIHGNFIGTDTSGTADLGNGSHGIIINNEALGAGIGGSSQKANTIAFNGGAGVYIRQIYPTDPIPTNVYITFNSIYSNDEEGIDLADPFSTGATPNDSGDVDSGPNDFLNYPELNYALSINPTMTISGEIIDGLPNTQFEIQFFHNPVCDSPSNHGEGKTYLGSSTQQTDGNGNVQFLVSFPANASPGSFITSTATTGSKTSEFSGCVEVQDMQTYSQENDPCDSFDPDQMTITTFDVRPESGLFILYVKNPEPYPVIGPEGIDLEYYATLGDVSAKCDFEGFDNRAYCYFYIPETYYNTNQIFNLNSNFCVPLYVNKEVPILTKDPGDPTVPGEPSDPDQPEGCHSGLDQRDCISKGGIYNDGVCTCPRRSQ